MIKIMQIDEQPLTKIGEVAGVCYGTTNPKRFYNIGKTCIEQNHGRVMEFTNILFTFDGYSAKVIRELFRNKAGTSELQASTRYIEYSKDFDYVVPHSVKANPEAFDVWERTINSICQGIVKLEELGIPNEDRTNLLPLAYATKGVYQINLRELLHVCRVRLCTSAYWEYRMFMQHLLNEIKEVSDEWRFIVENYCKPKCDFDGHCSEARVKCGRHPLK